MAATSNDRNEDLPTGYIFTSTDQSLLISLIKLHQNERFSTEGRLARVDLFSKHPALVINENKIDPGMRDNRNYYYFYCAVPDGNRYDVKGYEQIRNREDMGLWEKNGDSTLFFCDIPGRGRVFGEKQTFLYTHDQRETNWRMRLYGFPDRQIDIGDGHVVQSNMVICQVFERAESETAEAVRSAAEAERNFNESLTLKVSQAAKVEQMEAALKVEQAKYASYLATTDDRRGVRDERLTDRANAEQMEANDIIARR